MYKKSQDRESQVEKETLEIERSLLPPGDPETFLATSRKFFSIVNLKQASCADTSRPQHRHNDEFITLLIDFPSHYIQSQVIH